MEWNFKVVSGNRCPRQFEYHPSKQGMVFGTITGEVCAIDIYNGETKDNTTDNVTKSNQQTIPIKSLGYYGKNKNDTMLGLCWLRPPVGEYSCNSLYGGSHFNSNLFISGSSQGRVCMGDANRSYNPLNHEGYSIIHDYPIFDRLTSVHINSTNNLLLMSGYSTGINIVDLETSQMVRKYENIHSDHVNISRFCNLSPHLLATSSFDSTIKTWDLRQSNTYRNGLNKPIYEVKCNSGVVMINFSADDNFILASALDNEINQFMFLDGRKHLTYNLPKTGLKGNFTRAYYSASGRHTLTGACEESTVKLMCTYTGEYVTNIDLYPGKKDKSIYIQSLRGCPIDEDQICVLANYRDMQNRELVVVSRDHHYTRQQRLDQQLPVREEANQLNQQLPVREEANQLNQQLPVRAEANQLDKQLPVRAEANQLDKQLPVRAEADEQGVLDWFSHSIQQEQSCIAPIVSEINTSYIKHSDNDSVNNSNLPVNIEEEDTTALVVETDEDNNEKIGVSGPETEETEDFQANNSLMTFYSAQYIEHMRSLCSFAATAFESYSLLASKITTNMVCSDDKYDTPEYRIEVKGREGLSVDSYTDLIALVHTTPLVPRNSNYSSGSSSGGVFILALHSFILKARCPKLFKLYSTTTSSSKITVTLQCNNDIDTSTTILPVIDLTSSTDGDTGNSNNSKKRTEDCSISTSLLYLLPLLVDYFYTGIHSVDMTTMRYYCLQQLIRLDDNYYHHRSIFDLLYPMVGELLGTELQEYEATRKVAEKGLFMSYTNNNPINNMEDSSNSNSESIQQQQQQKQYNINSSRYFLPIQDVSSVEILLKVCIDDHCWRQNSTLSLAIVRTIADLFELTRCLELECLESTLASILEHAMCPHNAISIYNIAIQYECTELIRVSLCYITNHMSIFSKQLVEYPALERAVTDLSMKHTAQVISRVEFRDRKSRDHPLAGNTSATASKRSRSSTLQMLRRYLTGEQDSDDESFESLLHSSGDMGNANYNDNNNNIRNDPFNSNEDNEFLWMHEELPFLSGSQQHQQYQNTTTYSGVRTVAPVSEVCTATSSSAGACKKAYHLPPMDCLCLPRYISTSVVPFLTDHVIFLGGQNLDRLHTLGNRILCYNCTTKEFRYISTGGTHIPKCGYMSSISALQRGHTTHIVALGGKIKKAEISVKHTTLPQHFHTMNTADHSVVEAMKPSSLRTSTGIHIDNSASVSLMHNRLVDIWNLNADREELSQPSAEASAAASTAVLTALNSTTVDAEGCIVRTPKVQDLLQSMGAIYELDCVTLTWRSPGVEIISKTQLNTYNAQNIAMRLEYEQELQHSEDALRHRVAQAVSSLYTEDLAYRCCKCVFTTNPGMICTCSHSNNTKETPIQETKERTWLLQFGGFCDKSESILNDLHVLHCERSTNSSSNTSSTSSVSDYKYRWSRINASGTAPHGRFSHTSIVFPYNPALSSQSLPHRHTRVLYFGGAGYQPDMSPLCSLRINHSSAPTTTTPSQQHITTAASEIGYYAHWEDIVVTGGRSPPPVQGHTMVRIPETSYCILYGGAFTGDQGVWRNTCNPDAWLLCLEDVTYTTGTDSNTTLHVHWEKVRTTGIPPSLRARHCSFTVPSSSSNSGSIGVTEMLVFGGVDEAKLSRRQARGSTGSADFDDEVKDSILHTLQFRHTHSSYEAKWLPTTTATTTIGTTRRNPFQPITEYTHNTIEKQLPTSLTIAVSFLVYFSNDLSVRVRECALSRDMMSLLNDIFSDTSLHSSQKQGMNIDEQQQEVVVETEQRLKSILKEFRLYTRATTTIPTGTTNGSSLLIQLLNSNSSCNTTNTTIISSLRVYKSLLCTRCSWFDTMFHSNMKESQQSTGCIELTDIDPCAFRLLLLYIYTDSLMICSLRDIIAVLELANQFNLTSLAKRCEGALVRLVTLDNACELLEYADTLNLQILKTICITILLRDLVEVEVELVVEDGVQVYKNSSSNSSKKTVGNIVFVEYMNESNTSTANTSTSITTANTSTSSDNASAIATTTKHLSEEYLARIKAIVAEFADLSEELRLEIWHMYQLHTQVYCTAMK